MPVYTSVSELPPTSEKFPPGLRGPRQVPVDRTFWIVPEGSPPHNSESSWTFVEELQDGTLGPASDLIGVSGPKGFVRFHLGVVLR